MAYHPFRNLGLKFLSTLVAILLWLVVAGERVVERVMRAPVEFQNLPAGLFKAYPDRQKPVGAIQPDVDLTFEPFSASGAGQMNRGNKDPSRQNQSIVA